MSITPVSRPGLRRSQVQQLLLAYEVDIMRPAILGIRAYYLRTMGQPTLNDIGVYDDAIFVLSPTAFVAYNANCDPSIRRYGVANLREGVWRYKLGIHGLNRPAEYRYQALVQADEVIVDREQKGSDEGYFGINIHRGGEAGTSSLGCQTIPPSQWYSFINLVEGELKRFGKTTIPYCLVSNEDGKIA